jgi:hypothetical protein
MKRKRCTFSRKKWQNISAWIIYLKAILTKNIRTSRALWEHIQNTKTLWFSIQVATASSVAVTEQPRRTESVAEVARGQTSTIRLQCKLTFRPKEGSQWSDKITLKTWDTISIYYIQNKQIGLSAWCCVLTLTNFPPHYNLNSKHCCLLEWEYHLTLTIYVLSW